DDRRQARRLMDRSARWPAKLVAGRSADRLPQRLGRNWLRRGPQRRASVVEELRAAVSKIGGQIEVLVAGNNAEIDAAFANLVEKRMSCFLKPPASPYSSCPTVQRRRIQGLLISTEPLFANRLLQIVTLATRHAVRAIYPSRFWAEAGGLMSYGSSFTELHRQAGIYTGRVLKGEKPKDIPVLRAAKFELVINLVTAKT